jgi:hypothetical protein
MMSGLGPYKCPGLDGIDVWNVGTYREGWRYGPVLAGNELANKSK